MISRLFVPMNTFFPDRHQTFIQHLHRHFGLIVHETGPWSFSSGDVIDTTAVQQKLGDITTMKEFKDEWNHYCQFIIETANRLPGISLDSEKDLPGLETAKRTMASALGSALVFSEVARKTKIDAVVTCTDYTRHARPIVYMAAQLGIPTVHVEHGLFAIQPYPAEGQKRSAMAPFASNFVILDNPLEVDIYTRRDLQPSVKELLPLGTPLDNSTAGASLNREQARTFFNISPDEHCITLALSWSEPHGPDAIFRRQADEVALVRKVFDSVQQSSLRNRMKIILKLHPAMKDFGQYPYVKNWFRQLALDCGMLSRTIITAEHLPETIAAADVVMAQTYSSVLWDSILQNTAAAIALPSLWTPDTPDSAIPDSAVSAAGLLTYVRNETDLLGLIDANSTDSRRKEHGELTHAFFNRWDIRSETAAVKSERIVSWLKTFA
jgi:hypothetical protein